jgi:hypothetical protein
VPHADRYVVAIVVDPEFGDRITALVERMPVWMADTETNRTAVGHVRSSRAHAHDGQSIEHTAVGAVTTFTVDAIAPRETWCLDILGTVAGHHDRYSHSPGYSALEVYGVAPTPRLRAALVDYGLTEITLLPDGSGGFRAVTADGGEAGSPNA